MPTTTTKSTLTIGDTVTIYEDPLTETKPEGTATLIRKQRDNGWWDGRADECWLVTFDDEPDEEFYRSILVPLDQSENH